MWIRVVRCRHVPFHLPWSDGTWGNTVQNVFNEKLSPEARERAKKQFGDKLFLISDVDMTASDPNKPGSSNANNRAKSLEELLPHYLAVRPEYVVFSLSFFCLSACLSFFCLFFFLCSSLAVTLVGPCAVSCLPCVREFTKLGMHASLALAFTCTVPCPAGCAASLWPASWTSGASVLAFHSRCRSSPAN